jgi:ERCC4-type nuclease
MNVTLAYALCLLEKLRKHDQALIDKKAETRCTLYVDSEEPKDLRTRLISDDSTLTIQKCLPCGDYWFCYQVDKVDKVDDKKEQLVYVVERKSLSDFNTAIDERHENQLFRLLNLPLPRPHIIYFIEYQDEKEIQHYKGIDTILREIIKIQIQYGFSIYWCPSKNFTLLYLCHLLSILMYDREKLKFHFEEKMYVRNFPPVQDLFEFAKKGISKKGNDSPELLFLNQLRQIRGMGEAKAKAIAREYPSWSSLEKLRRSIGNQQAIVELANLSIDDLTKRRVGKAIGKKVIHALVGK